MAAENVDFKEALKLLAERTGVALPERSAPSHTADERERVRQCLEAAAKIFRKQLQSNAEAQAYLRSRGVDAAEEEREGLGLAVAEWSGLYEQLLKAGFSRTEILGAGLAIQKDLGSQRVYDRFRNRLMFPIHDVQGRLVGLSGRALGDDDAKYMNSPDGPLFHKAQLLYGFHRAKDAMRQRKSVILVEGYFDVLACKRSGTANVVATCGTALTEEHVKILRRSVDRVVLCLDRDEAGRQAAERAFSLLCATGLEVYGMELPEKDAADLQCSQPELLSQILTDGGVPYLDLVIEELRAGDLSAVSQKRKALQRLLPLLQVLPTSVERSYFLPKVAALLKTTETELTADMQRFRVTPPPPPPAAEAKPTAAMEPFSSAEIALGLFLLHPKHLPLLQELITPEQGFAHALYAHCTAILAGGNYIHGIPLPPELSERANILRLFCEEHGFSDWTASLVEREIRRNCINANRTLLRSKQREISQKLFTAKQHGDTLEEELLRTQYQQILKLDKMAA
jgi:DNA primase